MIEKFKTYCEFKVQSVKNAFNNRAYPPLNPSEVCQINIRHIYGAAEMLLEIGVEPKEIELVYNRYRAEIENLGLEYVRR